MVRFAISAMVLLATFTGCGSSAWWSAAEGSSPQTRGNDKTDARAKADKPDARAKADKPDARADAIARAQIWTPTDVPSMDVKVGPKRLDSFPFRATLTCDYLPKELSGASPKFACRLGDEDEIKVKFGGANAEVYAEVAATRLLWALGFPSDQM